MILRAPVTTSRSPVNSATSESLRITQSTSAIAATSASRGDVDPQVHGVQRDEARALALPADVELQRGQDVRQEQDVGVLGRLRELGLEGLEDVEVGLERVARVHVLAVDAAPEERLAALDVLDVVGDHAAAVQDGVLVVAEVVADRPDDADVVEERRGEGEVDGGAAEHALAPAVRRLHGVEGDRSTTVTLMDWALSVRSRMRSRGSRRSAGSIVAR